jgi:thiamine biosynthesis lipoprotein
MAELIQKSFRAMGTVNTVTGYRKAEEAALQAAVHRVLDLDDRLSAFKASSEVSQINAAAGRCCADGGRLWIWAESPRGLPPMRRGAF